MSLFETIQTLVQQDAIRMLLGHGNMGSTFPVQGFVLSKDAAATLRAYGIPMERIRPDPPSYDEIRASRRSESEKRAFEARGIYKPGYRLYDFGGYLDFVSYKDLENACGKNIVTQNIVVLLPKGIIRDDGTLRSL